MRGDRVRRCVGAVGEGCQDKSVALKVDLQNPRLRIGRTKRAAFADFCSMPGKPRFDAALNGQCRDYCGVRGPSGDHNIRTGRDRSVDLLDPGERDDIRAASDQVGVDLRSWRQWRDPVGIPCRRDPFRRLVRFQNGNFCALPGLAQHLTRDVHQPVHRIAGAAGARGTDHKRASGASGRLDQHRPFRLGRGSGVFADAPAKI